MEVRPMCKTKYFLSVLLAASILSWGLVVGGTTLAQAQVQIQDAGQPASCEILAWRLYENSRRNTELRDLLDLAVQNKSLNSRDQIELKGIISRMDMDLPEIRQKNIQMHFEFKNEAQIKSQDLQKLDIDVPSLSWHDQWGQAPDNVKVKFVADKIVVDISIFKIDYCFGSNEYVVALGFKDNRLALQGKLRR